MNTLLAILAVTALSLAQPVRAADTDAGTFDEKTVLDEVKEFFGEGAEGLADVVKKVFGDQGRPNAFIKGEEAAAAIGVGVRYGAGTLVMKNGQRRQVYWQGPSIGFDLGANAVKVFVLVYNLETAAQLFQRYPGVEGSLYFVGGVGVTYLQSDRTVLAPIRFGVGWRQGVSVGYMHFTRQQSLIPF